MDARVHQAFESSLENFVEITFKPVIMTNFAHHKKKKKKVWEIILSKVPHGFEGKSIVIS